DAPGHLREQTYRVGVAVLLLARREQRSEIRKTRRTEDRVGDRVGNRVTVGVAGETGRVRDGDSAEHKRRGVSERVNVESQADPVSRHARAPWINAWAISWSSTRVSLRLRGSPSTTTTLPPAAS